MTITLFALLILGHQAFLWRKQRSVDPFDIKTLINAVLFMMWVYAPLVDEALRARLESDLLFASMTFAGILALYLGLHTPFRSPPRVSKLPIIRERWFWFCWFLFVVGTIVVVYERTKFSGIGLMDLLTGDRLGAVQARLNEANEGSIPDRVIWIAQPVLLVWLAICFMQRRWVKGFFLYITLMASIVFIATTRIPVILTLLLPAVYIAQHRARALSIPLALTLAAASIVLLYTFNIIRGQGLDAFLSLDFTLYDALSSIAVNFNPMRGYEILWLLERSGRLSYEIGLAYLYVPLTAVPRLFWPDKPLTSIEARWTTELFGQHFARTDEGVGVWTFTVWGEGLVQFGLVGIIVNLYLYGLLIGWMDNKFGRRAPFGLVWFYYSVLAATFLRSSLSALAWTFFMAFVPLAFFWYMATRGSTSPPKRMSRQP
jgi:oligosaccharide repeat unit polymerase